MSVSGILSNSFLTSNAQAIHSRMLQFEQEFQQLGQDLQSGNVSAAQSDFSALQQSGPLANSTSSSTQNTNPLTQDFNQLAQDLQAGNVSAAQQDYAKVQQDLQNQASQFHHHHHHFSTANIAGAQNEISQLFTQLGSALQAGSVSVAQQAYSSLLQDFQQFGLGGGLLPASTLTTAPSTAANVSVMA